MTAEEAFAEIQRYNSLTPEEQAKEDQQDFNAFDQMRQRAEKAEAENKRLREALEKYAEEKNWSIETPAIWFENEDGSTGSYVAEMLDPIIWRGDKNAGYSLSQEALEGSDVEPAPRP